MNRVTNSGAGKSGETGDPAIGVGHCSYWSYRKRTSGVDWFQMDHDRAQLQTSRKQQ
jgi:hypothetical protein